MLHTLLSLITYDNSLHFCLFILHSFLVLAMVRNGRKKIISVLCRSFAFL